MTEVREALRATETERVGVWSAPLQATTVARQAGRVERRRLSVHDLWPPLLTFALVIGLWELAVWFFQIPFYLLPAPSQILETFLARPAFLLRILTTAST